MNASNGRIKNQENDSIQLHHRYGLGIGTFRNINWSVVFFMLEPPSWQNDYVQWNDYLFQKRVLFGTQLTRSIVVKTTVPNTLTTCVPHLTYP